jgi:hypothetical protein
MDPVSIANLCEAIGAVHDPIGEAEEFDGVWREHMPVVDAFLAVSSQWRTISVSAGGVITPMGGGVAPTVPLFVGLDYAAVKVGLDAERIEITPDLWRDLRIMEAAACAALNEER